jgi:hypothetical protein
VFDADAVRPLQAAQVEDLGTGWSAFTTSTGTVSLSFVDTLGSLIRIRKPGYGPYTLFVSNSARDTIPVTVLLQRVTQLDAAVIRAAPGSRGPADTVRALELNGYYERRRSSGAPASAFVTLERIKGLTLVSDVRYLTVRGICKDNLYLDGMRIKMPDLNAPSLTGSVSVVRGPLRDGLDALLNPTAVLAIELLRGAEVPPQYNGTAGSCATLVWTR